jgi:ATP-dependent protease ClpP protease subunit
MNNEIKIYGEIGTKEANSQAFTSQLKEIEGKGATAAVIRINSLGGDVIDGNVMFNAMMLSPLHIKIVVDGLAASMASLLLIAADEVEICENAFVMIHRPTGGGGGNADTLESIVKPLRDIENVMIQCFAKKTGISESEIKTKWFDGNDHWLNADEAVQYHLADRKTAAVAKDIKTLNVKALKAVSLNNIYSRFAASLNNKNDNNMKKELIEVFELKGVTAESSDEEVIQKLVEKFDALEKQVNESTENQINALLDEAQNDKKITHFQRNTYKSIGQTAGISALATVLKDIRPIPSITDMILDENKKTATDRPKSKADWTLDDYRKHAPNELKNNPQLYNTLVKKEYGGK